MTATPIPRSLALSIYGDLDVSILREKPPGRAAVQTRWLGATARAELETALAQRLERGEQAYWVVPRIDDADDGAPGAQARFAKASESALARHGVELVHGRMPSPERAQRLDRFRSGAARLLIATTVIEVGVDVPRATAIVIEGAERLGLAQLHQLRGRVGRSDRASACFLLGKVAARERLELLERVDDGFEIAERDLELRGMGDLLGLRQAGVNTEGLGRGELDVALLVAARDLLAARPELAHACTAEGELSASRSA
jgi:ATP-dependent DNA helicase RecG